MSSNSVKHVAAVLACLLAIAGFVVVSLNQTNQHNISEEQAINILKTQAQRDHGVVDPVTVWGGTLVNAELRFTTLDWSTYLDGAPHTRLYVNETTPKGPEPYWFISYTNSPNGVVGETYDGKYIVDADTGAIMLSMEDVGGGVTVLQLEPYYGVSFSPNVANVSTPLPLSGVFTVRITPKDSWVDSMPVYVSLQDLPSDATATQNVTSVILRRGLISGILFKIDVPGVSNDFHIASLKEVHVETRFLQTVRDYTIYVID